MGNTTTLIKPKLATTWSGRKNVIAVDGREVKCKGFSTSELTVHGVDRNYSDW